MQQCKVRLAADVELQQQKDQAQIDYLNQVVVLERKKYDTVVGDYQKRVGILEDQLREPTPWYKSTWFGVVVGVVGTVAVGAATAYLVSAVK